MDLDLDLDRDLLRRSIEVREGGGGLPVLNTLSGLIIIFGGWERVSREY